MPASAVAPTIICGLRAATACLTAASGPATCRPSAPSSRTQPGSPAERAGLRGIDEATGSLDDILVGAEGKAVTRLAELKKIMAAVGIGGQMTLVVERNGRTFEVKLLIRDVGAGRG